MVQRQQQRGEPSEREGYSLTVEDTCKAVLVEVITLWGARELIFEGVSPWYLYVKDCLSLYAHKCHKEHESSIKSV